MEITKIRREDRGYPYNLEHIYDPPHELYVQGSIAPSDINAVAIVGTRTPTYYGIEQCTKLSFDLAVRGVTIISGMARGIDSAAHKGALKAGGRTIAVLGSGHNHLYPPENKKLYNEIIQNGAAISEFPPDTPPLKANFPRRNRIISGMSKGVVVVEAAARSGSLITAHFALEQNREVFATPGNINSAKSNGTNRLIKEGAILVENAQDILDELMHVIEIKPVGDGERGTKNSADTHLGASDEKTVFGILNSTPQSIDEISQTAHLSVQKVAEILFKLELKRLIKALPGEHFVKCV